MTTLAHTGRHRAAVEPKREPRDPVSDRIALDAFVQIAEKRGIWARHPLIVVALGLLVVGCTIFAVLFATGVVDAPSTFVSLAAAVITGVGIGGAGGWLSGRRDRRRRQRLARAVLRDLNGSQRTPR